MIESTTTTVETMMATTGREYLVRTCSGRDFTTAEPRVVRVLEGLGIVEL